ncbi:ABC transporter permease [Pseudomonas syringae group sp. J309-1]|uniref:ABC transporter permease n=1 Tax=Pseudomonas syringae group sp. J309-1 TaxID=3079588 RepID=UPI00290B71A6|nr:ABC transporter permease [Pseudomonas syringae group sp. J309-1]MDU8362133.1 ABC transporter permease [Pseudomonas syringae group sp. J309-1]
MEKFSVTPIEMYRSGKRYRQLIAQMTQREISSRYKGSIFGILWAFLTPILMLAVYTFVFSVVFKARWVGAGAPDGEQSKADFAIMLFTGMIVYGIFAECVNRAPGLILGNPNYVKRVVFPLDILPWTVMGTALFNASISFVVLIAFFLLTNHVLTWTALLLPVVLLPLVFLCMGLSWFLSSLGVYLRDVGQTVGIVTTVLMFMSPVFYPLASLPLKFQFYLRFNPLTSIIEQTRDVLLLSRVPDPTHLLISILISMLIAWLGFAWFQKTRRGFADVI